MRVVSENVLRRAIIHDPHFAPASPDLGHVFQQRFWSGAIEDQPHFLAVLRYIEANPVAGSLVRAAESWPWSSLALRENAESELLETLPLTLPAAWSVLVNDQPWQCEPD